MTDTPEQLALHQILDVFGRLPDASPADWLNLLELVSVNVFRAIDPWTSVAERSLVAEQLHHRLITNLLALDMADGAVAGHA